MFRLRKVLLYLGIIALAWIPVLSIPQLRTQFLAQTFYGGNLPTALPSRQLNFDKATIENPQDLAVRLAQISQRIKLLYDYNRYKGALEFGNPNDISEVPKPVVDEKTINKKFAQLIHDFPNSPLPVFAFLTYSMKDMSPIREGGRLTDPNKFTNEKKDIPSPERSGKKIIHINSGSK